MEKDNRFLKGAAILSIAGIIVKILGALYRVPLSNIIKSEGMGYYQTAYPFYALLLTISTAGFPVAIAKIVSERRSVGDYKNAHKVFKVAMVSMASIGAISSMYLFFNAEKIVLNLGNGNAYYSLIALAPAVLFVSVMSVFRGYFQGAQNMLPTAVSQIFEQLFRVILGLTLTYVFLERGIPEAAGGASFGGTVGAITGTLAIVFMYIRERSNIFHEIENGKLGVEYSSLDILKDLFKIAIPITIGAAIAPIMDYIDIKIVLKRLQLIGWSEAGANDLYGNLKGMAQTLINLPQVFAVAISMSLVPAVSDAKISRDNKSLKETISSGIKITVLIGFPAAVGLFVLARPIISLLYYKNTAETILNTGNLLMVLSIGVVFLTLVQSLSAILQGLGKPLVPAVNLFIGAIIKAILTYNLTVIPSVNIYGAAISTVVAFGIAAVLDLIAVKKYSGLRLSYVDIFKGPFLSAIGMGATVFVIYKILGGLIGYKIGTLLSILVGVLVYGGLLIKTGSILESDLKLLPKSDKLIKIFNKINKK